MYPFISSAFSLWLTFDFSMFDNSVLKNSMPAKVASFSAVICAFFDVTYNLLTASLYSSRVVVFLSKACGRTLSGKKPILVLYLSILAPRFLYCIALDGVDAPPNINEGITPLIKENAKSSAEALGASLSYMALLI